jgi:hypothetical protein
MPKYDKNALELFNKRAMCNGQDMGTCDFKSANVMRNSIRHLNLDSGTDRFKTSGNYDKKGGHFAETTAVPSSFAKKKVHYPKDPDPVE